MPYTVTNLTNKTYGAGGDNILPHEVYSVEDLDADILNLVSQGLFSVSSYAAPAVPSIKENLAKEAFKKASTLANIQPLPLDANGNLIANIVPRTGLSADLKSLTTGGVGELAYATDTSSIWALNGAGTAHEFTPMKHGIWDDATYTLKGALDASGIAQSLRISGAIPTSAGYGGGAVYISGGDGPNVGGNASYVTIEGGKSYGVTSIPGDVNINGGAVNNVGNTTVPGGNVYIATGFGRQAGAQLFLSEQSFTQGISVTDQANGIAWIGFYDQLAGTAQPSPAVIGTGGTRTAVAGGNAVDDNDTFTGGVGTTGYTIGQVVGALKKLGLLAL